MEFSFEVDLENGQKTGYFLDQQDNRRAIQHIVKDAEVLGAFCYTGSFEVHAGYYGAKSVLGLDISENAVAQARRNAILNGLEDKVRFEAVNAFDVLKKWSRETKKFDVVMLDPPAFTKSRENIGKALSGYKEINLRGMKLLRSGGFLVTFFLYQPGFTGTISGYYPIRRQGCRQKNKTGCIPDAVTGSSDCLGTGEYPLSEVSDCGSFRLK